MISKSDICTKHTAILALDAVMEAILRTDWRKLNGLTKLQLLHVLVVSVHETTSIDCMAVYNFVTCRAVKCIALGT